MNSSSFNVVFLGLLLPVVAAICGKVSKLSFDVTERSFSSQEPLLGEFICLDAMQDGALQNGSDNEKWSTWKRPENNITSKAILGLAVSRFSPWCQV